MSTIYPNEIDTDLELPRVDDNLTEIGGDAINSLRDAVLAIENVLGANPQGNLTDLVARINNVIDDNGNLRASAIEDIGLVSLPINNSHIDANAAIEETKLDLDYTTSSLNARIANFSSDVDALRSTITSLSNQNTLHFSGLGNRHDGYQIDLTFPIRGGEDVETALNLVSDELEAHKNSVLNAHNAFAISINDEFKNISASNVQEALVELDNLEVNNLTTTLSEMRGSSVSSVDKGQQGEQGNLKETLLASTIFQTDILNATNILQVMRPNVARVTSKDANLRLLVIGSVQNLRIQANGIDRDPIDINLSSIIPTDDIDEIVEAINDQCVAVHYPISAYNTFGRLTIAHNIPGEEFSISIENSVSNSADVALGFGDISGQTIEWANNNGSIFIDGQRLLDAKSLIKIHYTHSAPLDTIEPGLGNLALLGFTIGNAGRILCNITNHNSDSTANGTYYITAFPDSESFILSEDVTAGDFDIEVPADAVNFNNSTSGEIYDIFAEADEDGYYIVSKSLRASYGTLSGVSIRAITEEFSTDNVDWRITDAAEIQFVGVSTDGEPVIIPSGFVGQLKVYSPDGVESALLEVTGSPASGTRTVTVNEFVGDETHLYLSSVHYSGNFGITTLKFVTDRRKFGGLIKSFTDDKLNKEDVEQVVDDLRSNGVVRGLDVISNTATTLTIRGGRAYIEGRALQVPTQVITVNDFSPNAKLLLLDRYGNFVIKSELDSGYSFSELTEGDSYGDNRGFATISSFNTDNGQIDGYIDDRRLLIGNIDKRVVDHVKNLNSRITQIQNVVSGSFWGNLDAYQDNSVASLGLSNNPGFLTLDEDGLAGGNNLVTTRRFEFTGTDSLPHLQATKIFASPGLTHINVMVEVRYTGASTGPFGTSGNFGLDMGVAVVVGRSSPQTYEQYENVKTIDTDILPSTTVTERYVISIPVFLLSVETNGFFSVYPRVRVTNSTTADGGGGVDPSPLINFLDVRVISSSYSIAGNVSGEDGSSQSLATTIGDVL